MIGRHNRMLNRVTYGDCIEVMQSMPWASVDFILTDPPYLVNYRDRSGRSIASDDDDTWLKPAFRQMHRVLRPDSLCARFYGWTMTDAFMTAWREARIPDRRPHSLPEAVCVQIAVPELRA